MFLTSNCCFWPKSKFIITLHPLSDWMICADFSPDSNKMTFSLEEVILWIEDSYFSQKRWFEVQSISLIDFQLFNSQDINWWTGGVWITCGLLWCFYQMFGLSFWRHPFTAVDPWDVMLHFSKSVQWTNKLDGLRVRTFPANFHFWVNYFLHMSW